MSKKGRGSSSYATTKGADKGANAKGAKGADKVADKGANTTRNSANNDSGSDIVSNWIKGLTSSSFIEQRHRRYVDPSILKDLPLLKYNKAQWTKLFLPPPNDEYEKLQLTEVGTYSIGQPDINRELIAFVKEMAEDVKLDSATLHITETNGGLGGFSSALLREFNRINITELNPTHFAIIKNNLEVYGFGKDPAKKIVIYNDDYLDRMMTVEQDIIISDPPWGGKSYVRQAAIQLGFSNIDICEVINFLNSHKRFKLFVFLAPMNYNFNSFMAKTYAKKIVIRKVRRHNFVCVFGSELDGK